MAKASFKLANGTVVTIEGTGQEVRELLTFYEREGSQPRLQTDKAPKAPSKAKPRASKKAKAQQTGPDLVDIVNEIKSRDKAEAIEAKVLDRTSRIDRVLLPLYIVHEYLDNAFGLTSGDISRALADLGVPVSQPNASMALSGTASRYVMGDKSRRKGQPVRYKLNRRGVTYFKAVLAGAEGGK